MLSQYYIFAGNFRCDCPAGYDWIYPSCVDINECVTTSDPCTGQNEQCINLSPGFTCSCYPGYIEPNCDRNETLGMLYMYCLLTFL